MDKDHKNERIYILSLQEETGAGFIDCKKALGMFNGNVTKAREYLRTNSGAKTLPYHKPL